MVGIRCSSLAKVGQTKYPVGKAVTPITTHWCAKCAGNLFSTKKLNCIKLTLIYLN